MRELNEQELKVINIDSIIPSNAGLFVLTPILVNWFIVKLDHLLIS